MLQGADPECVRLTGQRPIGTAHGAPGAAWLDQRLHLAGPAAVAIAVSTQLPLLRTRQARRRGRTARAEVRPSLRKLQQGLQPDPSPQAAAGDQPPAAEAQGQLPAGMAMGPGAGQPQAAGIGGGRSLAGGGSGHRCWPHRALPPKLTASRAGAAGHVGPAKGTRSNQLESVSSGSGNRPAVSGPWSGADPQRVGSPHAEWGQQVA